MDRHGLGQVWRDGQDSRIRIGHGLSAFIWIRIQDYSFKMKNGLPPPPPATMVWLWVGGIQRD